MANEDKKVITLICERAAELNDLLDANGQVKDVDGLYAVKFPCSGMIQPLMIEGAMKNGAAGVLVCGCQLGDCFYREGNKMIRERLLGERMPGLKKTVDRRRVTALWLSRVQRQRFISEAKEFVGYVRNLEPETPAPAAAAKAAAVKPGNAAPAAAEKGVSNTSGNVTANTATKPVAAGSPPKADPTNKAEQDPEANKMTPEQKSQPVQDTDTPKGPDVDREKKSESEN